MVAVRFGFGVSAVVAVGVRFWDAMRRRQVRIIASSWSGRLGSAMSGQVCGLGSELSDETIQM